MKDRLGLPASRAISSWVKVFPVMTRIGSFFKVGSCRIWRMTWKPSMPGISRSSSTALTNLEESTSRALTPVRTLLGLVSGGAEGLFQQFQSSGIIVNQQNSRIVVG